MKTILLLKGLPASGKSTFAKELVETQPGKRKRVNKDDIRFMVDGWRWSKFNESMVLQIRDDIILMSLQNWCSVVVDDTNFEPKHEERMREIAKEFKAKVEVKFFDTPISECIERDSKRANSVGAKVIWDMYRKYIKKEEHFNTLPFNKKLPTCIICDVDGTLANHDERDVYDTAKADTDKVIEPVKFILNRMPADVKVFIVSGRSDKYKEITDDRLHLNGVTHNKIFMRKEWDTRADTVIKKEIYEDHIKGKYNVMFAVDDRFRLVDQRRELWIFTFDVNQTRSVF